MYSPKKKNAWKLPLGIKVIEVTWIQKDSNPQGNPLKTASVYIEEKKKSFKSPGVNHY